MKHVIVIFHFICFAAGIGCVTYVYTLFRKRKLYRYLAVSEGIFSLWFLMDCIKSYMRNLISGSTSIDTFGIVSIALSVIGFLSFIMAVITIRKAKVQYRITILCKVFMLVTVFCLIGWIGTSIIDWLRDVPSLCLAFISQCICVVLITSNEVMDTKDWEKQLSHTEAPESQASSAEGIVSSAEVAEMSGDFTELTEREVEIVEYLAQGNSYKEIGEVLFISPNTVRNHTANIYRKLDVRNRIELINKLKTTK